MPKSKLRTILFVPDVHVPYHDTRAWELFLKVGTALKPDILVSIGDLADFYAVSSHSKSPTRAGSLDSEVAEVNLALDSLDALGARQKLFLAGNHEDRLRRYLQDKAPELFGLVDVPQLFRLKERGWEYTGYKDFTQIGNLNLTHDIGVAGRYSAFRVLDAFQASAVTGHTHRLSYLVEGNANGGQAVSAQFGWLGDAEKTDYMHRATAKRFWALGFGVGYWDSRSDGVHLVPVPILDYTCVVAGQLYEN